MALRDPLPADEIAARLARLDGWSSDTAEIHKTFSIDYYTSIKIINEVAEAAQELQHHPDIDLRWETPHFSVTTYNAGQRITELGFLLAERIEEVVGRYTVNAG
ncbi:4a-hydroxytetrahydrobiopterin dehydratase [Candidatus Protofrankia californiensis]|uniref:4a-hydroxytetrahydrobiopterin dehydratase n=1 Tax=Candidatus Protofrankia californiensis TaxID=1839754 RepID=UPI001040E812|nr:4a-hydroxytetrahydrobiopterin dehydratase [Candidatus Protofrankia californiensis]